MPEESRKPSPNPANSSSVAHDQPREPREPHEPSALGEWGDPDVLPDRAEPDVLLDIPQVKVDEINLTVEDLRARVSLDAEVLDLLRLHVGADVALGKVNQHVTAAKDYKRVQIDYVVAAKLLIPRRADES
ncbi:hypothetical protein Aph01nite_15700 [Acrocarpospora phusangensis]|uniref:Uncharacterized protein n=1 Tax=Acrocarpospora phusangensis TaxID=1070424 RepID=A0A919QAT0_9ACTN|nr:hypothetical protein [Acrocarpospora phusangensis]GIH23260.1 hypothetical protein Aph01nite_15700 [Acrocarpospora phusangensis]